MRESKRSTILDAAVGVIETDGMTAITFDSIAAATGVTRGGILYHFQSRDELIAAIHDHLARRWERQLEAACDKPVDQTTATERLVAYIRMAAVSATRSELQMILDSQHTEHQKIWDDVMERWTGRRRPGAMASGRTATIALLAADGLWVNEVLGTQSLSRDERLRTAEDIITLVQGDSLDTDASATGEGHPG